MEEIIETNENQRPDYKNEIVALIGSDMSPKAMLGRLADYHENDIADALDDLSENERKKLFRIMPPELLGAVFEYIDEEKAGVFLDEMDIKKASSLVGELDADTAVGILREIDKQKNGVPGHIRLKMNSLTDKVLMDKLIDASRAGVKIEMAVRGICCLRPGVEGITDNLKVISIVGRYLEHSRIYIFGDGDNAEYYISSADWMTRNTLRRVEVALPVYSEQLKKRLSDIFALMQSDNVQARDMLPDGSYKRRIPGKDKPVSCQDILYDEAYRQAANIL